MQSSGAAHYGLKRVARAVLRQRLPVKEELGGPESGNVGHHFELKKVLRSCDLDMTGLRQHR